MNSNQQNIVTSSQPYYSFGKPQGSIALPINSRLINQSSASNQNYFNNYQVVNQSQQLYSPLSTVPRQSIVYQNNISPLPIQKFSNSQVQQQQINQNLLIQQGSQGVRTRLVPVTQYVPVYELDNAQTVNNKNESIHQRVILHQPDAFKQRIHYEQNLQVIPTVIEEERIYAAAPPPSISVKVIKIQQDPLVETVQGQWKSRVSNSRNSYVVPPPLPREAKPCCSGWLFFLLALLALGGILTAILLGKAFSQQSINNSDQSIVKGTKVQATKSSVSIVEPLTDADISVKGRTAVTTPQFIKSTISKDNQPIKQQVQSIAATDISVVAQPKTQAAQSNQSTQPQKIGFGPVQPVVVSPLSNNYQEPSKISWNPTIPINSASLSNTIQPQTSIIQPNRVASVPSSVNQNPLTLSTLNEKLNTLTTEKAPYQQATIKPTTIEPIYTKPLVVEPTTFTPPTINPTTYVSSLARDQSLPVSYSNSYQIPAVVVSPKSS